jgi:AraC-like DNA-binding protein
VKPDSDTEQKSNLDIQLTNILLVRKLVRYPGEPWIQIPSRPFNSVVLNLAGTGEYIIDGEPLLFNEGDFFFFRSNIIHTHNAIRGRPHTYVYADFETSDDDIFEKPPFSPKFMLSNRSAFEDDFRKLLNSWENQEIGYLVRCREIFYRIFSTMIGSLVKEYSLSRQYDRIKPAVKYIQNNYMKDISIESLSALCNLSTRHLNRFFHTVYGKSPVDYKMEIRFRLARNLLQNASHTIGEISDLTGYNSIYSFSRAFKRFVGVSPREWRSLPAEPAGHVGKNS